MRLTYIYHSGFAIETEGYTILIDYFKDTGKTPDTGFVHDELLQRAGTLYILSTHFHLEREKTGYQIYFLQRHTETAAGKSRRRPVYEKRRCF